MGGAFPGQLPSALRAAAIVQALLLIAFAAVVLARQGVAFRRWLHRSRRLIWMVVAFAAVSLIVPAHPKRWRAGYLGARGVHSARHQCAGRHWPRHTGAGRLTRVCTVAAGAMISGRWYTLCQKKVDHGSDCRARLRLAAPHRAISNHSDGRRGLRWRIATAKCCLSVAPAPTESRTDGWLAPLKRHVRRDHH
jgi:hypothetical protein